MIYLSAERAIVGELDEGDHAEFATSEEARAAVLGDAGIGPKGPR